jgi:hypothetical protein
MFTFDDSDDDEASKSDDKQPIPADRKTKFVNYFTGATGEADKPRIAYYGGMSKTPREMLFSSIKEVRSRRESTIKNHKIFRNS